MTEKPSRHSLFVQLVGAGSFTACIVRKSTPRSESAYEIRLSTRTCEDAGEVKFSDVDLVEFMKVLQLLVSEITLDGNASNETRHRLKSLRDNIDRAWCRFEFEMMQDHRNKFQSEDTSATSSL